MKGKKAGDSILFYFIISFCSWPLLLRVLSPLLLPDAAVATVFAAQNFISQMNITYKLRQEA